MSSQTGVDASLGYFARLVLVVSIWAAQLVRPPSQAHRSEGARRLSRNVLTTAVIAAMLVVALMIWADAREIALMPPRGTPGLWPFRILTDFGKDTYVLLLVTFLLVAVALVAPATHGSTRRRLATAGLRLQFIWLALAGPLVFGELVKWIAGRGRPFVGGEVNPFNFVPFAGTAAHASFPSAHSITAFALAFAIAAIWPRMRGVMAAYALIIVFTRLVLLAHHPSDVVAGAAIGLIGAMCVRYWFAARALGFAISEAGIISPLPEGPVKKVAAKPSAS
ncbi:phosphatase PAP2 family protein [Bradyrhizobium sp.]|uniref:phosphatase PAP2 family protein n=1 Tax=Bradyrhizobium sp. TaxID=376 RepID=UPI00261EC818|nr:phosphatase PAP2 family protein [Bradyrhizobium sp.]